MRAGAAPVVRSYIVSVLTQVAKHGVWPDLAWDDIAQFFPHRVGKRLCLLLCARLYLRWTLLCPILVLLTCTSTCEVLIGFLDRGQVP